MNADQPPSESHAIQRPRLLALIEVALIFVLLFVFAASPPPGDDEPHYLGKAKQYWNPDWLAGDFFLETPDAHVVFNWTVGWLTLFFSLNTVAWIARCAAWMLLAVAWRRLSWALLPRPLVSLWTIAMFLVLQEHGTAAQEWIVRGVEAKCFAYAFVLLGLEQLVKGRWKWVWPWLGIAAAFHVLVGGWAVVAALLAWGATSDRLPLTKMLPSLVVGGILSLPGLVPSLQLSWNAAPGVAAEANQIYVFERLQHHLVVYDFAWRNKLQFTLVLVAWLVVCFLTRDQTHRLPLRRFVLGSIIIGIAGLVVDQTTAHLNMPEFAAALLRFYWYRLADVMVPLGLAFALAGWEMAQRKWPSEKQTDAMLFVLILAPILALGWNFAQRRADGRPMADVQAHIGESHRDQYIDWRQTCDWIQTNTDPHDRFMIPTHISSFRWYAQRSEVVSRKDIPQNPAGIVQWRERLDRVNGWYSEVAREGMTAESLETLRAMASPEAYDFQYIVLHAEGADLPLTEVCRTPWFVIYAVPRTVALESDSPD